MKLAEQTAAKIELAIAERGWPLGSVLGSEADLLAQYGVSRAVLREAVRLLEHDNVARMRRGPGGGLVVAEPDPEAVTRTATLYLRYRAVDPGQIFDARIALEVAAVRNTAERIDEAGIARLRAALAAEPSPATADLCAPEFHGLIADLSGNPAIQLFVDVVTTLTTATALGSGAPFDGAPMGSRPGQLRSVHADIAEAVIAGDVALAQHRMMRHLQSMAGALASTELPDVGAPGARQAPQSIDLTARTVPAVHAVGPVAVVGSGAAGTAGTVGTVSRIGPLGPVASVGAAADGGLSEPGAGSAPAPREPARAAAAGATTSRRVAASGHDAQPAGSRPAARRRAPRR
jgi:DNA-binding FadR family transcriptional regulator